MSKKGNCRLPLGKDGKKSKLYDDILHYVYNRSVANYIYANYLVNGAKKADQLGYKRNKQGEHNFKDVSDLLDLKRIKNEIGAKSIGVQNIAEKEKAIDKNGNAIDYTDAKEALDIAKHINDNYKGVVANVYSHNDLFNIVVAEKSSRTQMRSFDVTKRLQQWDVLIHAFNDVGIDINHPDLNKAVFNAANAEYAVQSLTSMQRVDNKFLDTFEIKSLLAINSDSPQVQRLVKMFGSIEKAAEKIYDGYRSNNLTPNQMNLINTTLNNCKKYKGLDLNTLKQQITTINQSVTNSEEQQIASEIDRLNKEYHIDKREIILTGNRIKDLTQVAANAAITLNRQMRQLKAEQGVTNDVKRINNQLQELMRSIEAKRYYIGLMGFMTETNTQLSSIDDMLNNINQSGTDLEVASRIASAMISTKDFLDGYFFIIDALQNIDKLNIDANLSKEELDTLKEQATNINKVLSRLKDKMDAMSTTNMENIAISYLGDDVVNGEAVVNIVSMATADSTFMDYFYSIADASNPLITVMGSIIRDAQSQRDGKMNNIALRIRRATNKLRKAGYSKTDFMYDENGYIISDIDWDKYDADYDAYKKSLSKKKLRGITREEAIEEWIYNHTIERTVDATNGRTERIPNNNYRKQFPNLTQEQREYYDTMMQIKGELGSLLPNYAQHQFRPPQIRRTFVDAWSEAVKKGSIRGVIKALKNKFKDYTTIREDDERYGRNGIIEGQDLKITAGTLSNNPYRQVPIFYINKIKDQGELLKDFSAAIQRLAGTAINYEAMNNIKDTINFMGDYVKRLNSGDLNVEDSVDLVEDNKLSVYKRLTKFARNTNTIGIIDGLIDKHIYGNEIDQKEANSKYHLWVRNLLQYTSLRALAVNLKGAIQNGLMGEFQLFIESAACEFFNPWDYAWANGKVFGDNTIGAPKRIIDWATNNVNSEAILLAQKFDPLNENFESLSHQRYHGNFVRKLISEDLSFIGYGAGENIIHFVTMYAILHNTKIKIDGKETNLYEAYSVDNKKDGNSELILNEKATYKDENGNDIPIDEEFLDKVRRRIRYTNQTMHGAMNKEDKGLVHRRMLGRLVMCLRQWMVGHYSRRFRARHWNATLGEEREGFYISPYKYMKLLCKDIVNLEFHARTHWNELKEDQRSNCRRAMAELLLLAISIGIDLSIGDPDDKNKGWWTRMLMYQVKRSKVDILGSTPVGIITEGTTILNNPIAATNVVNGLLYPVTGILDTMDTIKSGPHKGENRYLRNLQKYSVPFWGQIEQYKDFEDDEGVFKIFEKNSLQR